MVASLTTLPVIGVPVRSRSLSGVDSLHSIVQMPGGIPVATVAIGGGLNAGLLAAQILALARRRSCGASRRTYRRQLARRSGREGCNAWSSSAVCGLSRRHVDHLEPDNAMTSWPA